MKSTIRFLLLAALFTEDATLVPRHGDAPVKSQAAIRGGCFNPGLSPTAVKEFTRDAAEIVVSGDVDVLRGGGRLAWEYRGTRTIVPQSNYVMMAVGLAQ